MYLPISKGFIFRDLHAADFVVFDVVLVQRHEDDVDGDTQGDDEFRESVEHDEGQDFADFEPQPTAVPDARDFTSLLEPLGHDLLHLGAFVVVVVIVVVIRIQRTPAGLA